MMKSLDSDTKSAGMFAWAAMRDARMRNEAGKSKFTLKEQVRAERMKQGLGLVYHCKEIHINYRQKFIAVKIDAAHISDRHNLALLESDYEEEGVVKLVTDQGVTYRIPKA
jgi:hypothetical protein